jgi:HEPN domain-containing protein
MNAPHLEARRWFQEAQADLAVVRTLRGAGHHAAACFHSQQAAEKALKALWLPLPCRESKRTATPRVLAIFLIRRIKSAPGMDVMIVHTCTIDKPQC